MNYDFVLYLKFKNIFKLISISECSGLVAVLGLSLVVTSRGCSLLPGPGFGPVAPLVAELRLWVHGLSCP